jgi:hypothetical protein
MSQEYHNWITFPGTPERRLEITRAVLTDTPRNWEWFRVVVNDNAPQGRDSGETTLDFYSRNFPEGLGEMSSMYPDVRFECRCMDLTAEIHHKITLSSGLEVAYTQEPVVWDGGSEVEEN